MRATTREIAAHLAMLWETPRIIVTVAEQASEAQARHRPSPGAWSLFEQLAHLRACAEIWGDDIERMLAQDEPKYAKPHPRRVMQSDRLVEPAFVASARVFADLGARLLALLKPLAQEQWERGAIIDRRHYTVYTQTRRMAMHEAAHAGQIRAIWQAAAECEPAG